MHVLGDGDTSTWDHLRLDFSAYKARASQWSRCRLQNLELLLEIETTRRPPMQRVGLVQPAYSQSEALLRRAQAGVLAGDIAEAVAFAQQAVDVNPDSRDARRVLRRLSRKAARGRAAP